MTKSSSGWNAWSHKTQCAIMLEKTRGLRIWLKMGEWAGSILKLGNLISKSDFKIRARKRCLKMAPEAHSVASFVHWEGW